MFVKKSRVVLEISKLKGFCRSSQVSFLKKKPMFVQKEYGIKNQLFAVFTMFFFSLFRVQRFQRVLSDHISFLRHKEIHIQIIATITLYGSLSYFVQPVSLKSCLYLYVVPTKMNNFDNFQPNNSYSD